MGWDSHELEAKRQMWKAMQSFLSDNHCAAYDDMMCLSKDEARGLIDAMLNAYHRHIQAGVTVA